jgi:hypothetical protein
MKLEVEYSFSEDSVLPDIRTLSWISKLGEEGNTTIYKTVI